MAVLHLVYMHHQFRPIFLIPTPILKGPPSSFLAYYQPIFIRSVLSKVFECLVSIRFGRFTERSCVLPTAQFAYRKSLVTCEGNKMALGTMSENFRSLWLKLCPWHAFEVYGDRSTVNNFFFVIHFKEKLYKENLFVREDFLSIVKKTSYRK